MLPAEAPLPQACRLVAERFFGPDCLWLHEAYDAANREFFAGELPQPFIYLSLTAHGRCLAWTASQREKLPVIALHPSVFGGSEKPDPWGVPPEWLGRRFAHDVLLHEMIHVSVNYRLGGRTGTTSHNDPAWIAEVNRLAPLIGFEGVQAGKSVTKRVPVDGAEPSGRGKRSSRVIRTTVGNVPFKCVAGFPQALRQHRGMAAAHYAAGKT